MAEAEKDARDAEKNEKELSVEESFALLDEMTKRLEAEDVTLDESFQIYQKGMKILSAVNAKLDMYEKKMKVITVDGTLEDLDQ